MTALPDLLTEAEAQEWNDVADVAQTIARVSRSAAA